MCKWNKHAGRSRLDQEKAHEGNSFEFDHSDGLPTPEEISKYAELIRGLRDRAYEHIVFILMPDDEMKVGKAGPAFLQMVAEDVLRMHVEVALSGMDGIQLYARECEREIAVSIMEEMLQTGREPDLSEWEDISEEVFTEDSQREEREQIQREADRLNDLGWDLHRGLTSGTEDPKAAIPYYEQAAAKGSRQAMVNLGNIYEDWKDFEKAYYWYQEAALAGDETGMFNLANMYHWGWHVTQDYRKAYGYFKKLYRNGYEGSCFYMGLYSEYGYVGDVDYVAAIRYYTEGLERDEDDWCAVNLGRMYCLGLGTDKDAKKGFSLYLRGYEAGDIMACCNLGFCYETGTGVEQDIGKAMEYYRDGAEQGDENCERALNRLSGKN